MKILDSLEKRFGHLAVPNVILVLIVAQLFIYAAIMVGRLDVQSIELIPKAVFAGEWWRLFSFMIVPPDIATGALSALFLAFFWYILFFMSQALEAAWGVFRFNLYLLAAVFFAIVGAFVGQLISPASVIVVSTTFLYWCVFFAFATLQPNVQFLMFFIIPVKVKWIAWLVFGVGSLAFLGLPSMGYRIAFAAPFLCYVLFSKDAMAQAVKAKKRRSEYKAERNLSADDAMHTCSECGATDKSHPEKDFRYKTVDNDVICFCGECRAK